MTPGKHNIKHRRGDTYNGMSFEILLNDVPVDFTGAVAKMQLKRNPSDNPVIEWKSDDNSITFASNVITLQPKTGAQMSIEPGLYNYDLQVLLGSGVTNTYVEGIFEILNDITS